jgi:hypothetical protein
MDADQASVHDAHARARLMHADGRPIAAIAAATGLDERAVRHVIANCEMAGRPFATVDRAVVVQKLWESAARQVADLHARVLDVGLDADERERDVRMLAVMVKTMRELAALDDATAAGADDRDDEPDSRDIDEFRRELARRIDALVAAQSGEIDRGDAGA